MEMSLKLSAGPHTRLSCPVSCLAPAGWEAATLVDDDRDVVVPCQVDAGRLAWVVDELKAGTERLYSLHRRPSPEPERVRVEQGDGRITVLLGTEPWAVYHHGAEWVRPFLNPVIGPTGVSMVRELFDEEDPPEHDHIHHRGILVAHGLVNGTDNWSEVRAHGRQVHSNVDALVSGPVFGRIAVTNDWQSAEAEHVVTEKRVMTFWGLRDKVRLLDVEVTFEADANEVVFGDTKEGGILSVRMPTPLRVDRGGTMCNAYGGMGEQECWGKRAPWCDVSGELEGEPVGLAVFDHPSNFRHPTYWHIRDYGLFAANPFGLAHFYGDKTRDGSFTLGKGDTITFSYRVMLHQGSANAAGVSETYHNFANPPRLAE